MNNFDYHTNFRTAPKRHSRASVIKVWLKNVVYTVAVISSCVFLFNVFTSNSSQKNQVTTIAQSPTPKIDESIDNTTQKTQNEIKVIDEVNQISLKTATVTETGDNKQILPEKTTPMTSLIKASASLNTYSAKPSTDNTSVQLGRNNTVKKEEEIHLVASEKQDSQVDRIIKQITSDKTMDTRPQTTTKLSVANTAVIIPVKNNSEVALTKNQSIIEALQSLKNEPQEIDSIKDIQNIYQKNLDQLSKELAK